MRSRKIIGKGLNVLRVAALNFLFMALVHAAGAADYYVDKDSLGGPCSDEGPGTISQPWQTLGRIMPEDKKPCPQSGDTIWVRGGVYRETLLFKPGTMGLTIKAYAGEQPVIDCENKRSYGIQISGTQDIADIVIEGLYFKNHDLKGNAIFVNGARDITIRKVNISGAGTGVNFIRSIGCKVLESDIFGCGANIRVDTECADIIIADNHIHHSAGDGIDIWGFVNRMICRGAAVSSITPASSPGLAVFTTGETNLNFSKAHSWMRSHLIGQNEAGSEKYPDVAVFFKNADDYLKADNDAREIPGGAVKLDDGQHWFALRNNPEWGNLPFSSDGKSCLFEVGTAKLEELAQAKYMLMASCFDPAKKPRDLQILRNEIDHNGRQGLLIPAAEWALIKGNKLHHNGCTGIQVETEARHIWIDGNVSYANCTNGAGETGIWIAEDADITVQDNVMSENTRGSTVQMADRVLFRRNVIYNNRAQHYAGPESKGRDKDTLRKASIGLQIHGGGNKWKVIGAGPSSVERSAFVHNTFYGNCDGGDQSRMATINYGEPGRKIGRNIMMNNLLQSCRGRAVIDVWRNWPLMLDGNIYSSAAGPVKIHYRDLNKDSEKYYDLSTPAGLAEYQQATGMDQRSLAGEVAFMNPEQGDFHLAKGSLAIDKGVPLTLTTSSGKGDVLPVGNVWCFSAGFKNSRGETWVQGDEIMIGQKKARVVAIDWEKNTLKLDHRIKWKKNQPVSYLYNGSAPDVGAFEAE